MSKRQSRTYPKEFKQQSVDYKTLENHVQKSFVNMN